MIRRALGLALALLLAAPQPATATPPDAASAGSVGTAHRGKLIDGFDMPLSGHGYRFFAPVARRGTHHATVELAALVARAARVLQQAVPGPPVFLGDCSDADGGKLTRHASHQSGRDVDLIFLATDASGTSTASKRFVSYDGSGRCVEKGCTLRFDDRRNWWLVRTLLASRDPAVQWIFVATPIRRRLIAWAERHSEDANLLRRADKILRQPNDSSPHDDHFHVRIYCPPDARAPKCQDSGPRWPWVTKDGLADPIAP